MAPDDPIGDWLSASSADPREVAERYDAWAASYDADLDAWSYRAPAVVAGIALERGPASVLDVGCGTGLVGRALRSRGYVGDLRGLDLSEASLAIAAASGAYDEVGPADLQRRLPIDDDSAEAVLCVGVMTYLPDVEAVWRELARVAAPGGIVVVTQREDLWADRGCPAVVDRLRDEGVWSPLAIDGPAAYLPLGYGGTPAVGCYYLSATVS